MTGLVFHPSRLHATLLVCTDTVRMEGGSLDAAPPSMWQLGLCYSVTSNRGRLAPGLTCLVQNDHSSQRVKRQVTHERLLIPSRITYYFTPILETQNMLLVLVNFESVDEMLEYTHMKLSQPFKP